MISYKHSFYLLQFIERQRKLGKTIGFVPTMGALHEGHISLIEAAKQECDIVICSIFVNPTQFNNEDDLEKYPRTLNEDSNLLKAADCDILFNPSVNEMYPKGTDVAYKSSVKGSILTVLEGVHRPGHFEGMMQIVGLLLDKTNPTHLYMGLKDYQQFSICSQMVKAQKRKIIMRGMPIVREKNGLAMSSRNKRLSKKGKEDAAIIHQSLMLVKKNIEKENIEDLQKMGIQNIKTLKGTEVEYFEIVDQTTLLPSSLKENLIVLCAVWFEGVRLIDNMIL